MLKGQKRKSKHLMSDVEQTDQGKRCRTSEGNKAESDVIFLHEERMGNGYTGKTIEFFGIPILTIRQADKQNQCHLNIVFVKITLQKLHLNVHWFV